MTSDAILEFVCGGDPSWEVSGSRSNAIDFGSEGRATLAYAAVLDRWKGVERP